MRPVDSPSAPTLRIIPAKAPGTDASDAYDLTRATAQEITRSDTAHSPGPPGISREADTVGAPPLRLDNPPAAPPLQMLRAKALGTYASDAGDLTPLAAQEPTHSGIAHCPVSLSISRSLEEEDEPPSTPVRRPVEPITWRVLKRDIRWRAQVVNVRSDDEDGGLVVRSAPYTASDAKCVLAWNCTNIPCGMIAEQDDGSLWVYLPSFNGWTSMDYLQSLP